MLKFRELLGTGEARADLMLPVGFGHREVEVHLVGRAGSSTVSMLTSVKQPRATRSREAILRPSYPGGFVPPELAAMTSSRAVAFASLMLSGDIDPARGVGHQGERQARSISGGLPPERSEAEIAKAPGTLATGAVGLPI